MDDSNAYKLLDELVSIQSVSTDLNRKNEIDRAANFIKKEMSLMGFEVSLHTTHNCPPLVIGKKIVSSSAPTIGIYAHYDVQPEDPVDKWSSPPFEITGKGDKLFGRGVADDKMHLIQSMVAAKNLIDKNELKNNIVFVFEGEEETGSNHFEELVEKARGDLNNVDVFYVLDVGMKAKNIPQIYYGLRGIAVFELKIKIGETDLHSGVYGNRVLNAAQVAVGLMAKMKNDRGEVTIPGFYDNVKKITEEEISLLSRYVQSEEEEKKNAKVNKIVGGFLESKIKPSLEINGITSGYTGQGFKTIIPAEAVVKFSVRLVENQKGKEVAELVKTFVKRNMPDGAEYELLSKEATDPFYTDYNNSNTKKTSQILEGVFGGKCLFNRSGGSIAAAEIIQRLFKKPVILTGFTLPDENLHAPDENVDVEMFEKGIQALEKIFSS